MAVHLGYFCWWIRSLSQCHYLHSAALKEMQLNKKDIWSAQMSFLNVKMPYHQQILDACDAIFPNRAVTECNGVASRSMCESPP